MPEQIVRPRLKTDGTFVNTTWENVAESAISNTAETRIIIYDTLVAFSISPVDATDLATTIINEMVSQGILP